MAPTVGPGSPFPFAAPETGAADASGATLPALVAEVTRRGAGAKLRSAFFGGWFGPFITGAGFFGGFPRCFAPFGGCFARRVQFFSAECVAMDMFGGHFTCAFGVFFGFFGVRFGFLHTVCDRFRGSLRFARFAFGGFALTEARGRKADTGRGPGAAAGQHDGHEQGQENQQQALAPHDIDIGARAPAR